MQAPSTDLPLLDLFCNLAIPGLHGRPVSPDYVAHWFGKRYDAPTNVLVISRLAVPTEARLSRMCEDLLTRLEQLGIPASAIETEEWRLISIKDAEKAVDALCQRIRRDEIHAVAIRDLSRFGRMWDVAFASQVLDALMAVDGLLVTEDTVFVPEEPLEEPLDRLFAEHERRIVSQRIKEGRALAARRLNKA